MRLFVLAPIAIALSVFGSGCEERPMPELDAVGRSYLAPLRNDALAVPRLIERLRLRPSDVVADLGAGPGFLTLPLARAVPDGRVIATDVKRSYLDVLEARAKAEGIANVETRLVAEDESGLRADAVDVVVLCQVDQLLADRAGYFRGLVPSLKRGGRVVIVNYVRFQEVARAAAREASLIVADEWRPSEPFFVMVLEPAGSASTAVRAPVWMAAL